MNDFAKQLLVPLMLLGSVYSTPSVACAIATKEGAVVREQQAIETFKKAAAKVGEEADLIFVGRLSGLSFNDATVNSPKGHPWIMRTHQAVFEVANTLKGQHVKGQVLEFTFNKDTVRIPVGCYPFFWEFPKEKGVGDSYLVYAQKGKILRTNHIPFEQQVLGGIEEAAYVRESVKLQ